VIALVAGDSADERRASIQTRAAAVTGNVLVTVLVGGFIVAALRDSETASLVERSRGRRRWGDLHHGAGVVQQGLLSAAARF
jgi:uncharacterized iron-regulated membrane protein